jgi:hypothetical protein
MYDFKDAITDTLSFSAEFVSPNLKKVRIEICKSCDEFRKMTRTCGQCGCQMDLKVLYAKSECPKQKW